MKKQLLTVIATTILLFSNTIYANNDLIDEAKEKTVKIGFIRNYGIIQEPYVFGQEGYGYEYLKEISKYTNHKYEYIPVAFDDGLQMLESGEIDLFGPVNKGITTEDKYIFMENEFAQEEIYLLGAKEEVDFDEVLKVNKSKVGMYKNSIYEKSFDDYKDINRFVLNKTYILEDDISEFNKEEYDYRIGGSLFNIENVSIVDKLNEDSLYLVADEKNKAIIQEIDDAVDLIESKDERFNENLYLKYYNINKLNQRLTKDEIEYLKEQKEYNIGYNGRCVPLIYEDDNGNIQGVSIDVIKEITKNSNFKLNFIDTSDEKNKNVKIDIHIRILKDDNFDVSENSRSASYAQIPMTIIGNESSRDKEVKTMGIVNYASSNISDIKDIYSEYNIKKYNDIKKLYEELACNEVDEIMVPLQFTDIILRGLNSERHYIKSTNIDIPIYFDYSNALSNESQVVFDKLINNLDDDFINKSLINHTLEFKEEITVSEVIKYNKEYILMILAILISIIIYYSSRVRIRRNNEFKKLLETDNLTQLMSGYKFISSASEIINSNKEQTYFLLTIDIDNFKYINETYGYENGDEVLKRFAKKLTQCYCKNTLLARMSSDKFLILLKDYSRKENELNLETLSKGYGDILGNNYNLTLSQGIYVVANDDNSVDYMIDCSNHARSLGKQHYSNTIDVFTESMKHNKQTRNYVVSNMEKALKNNEFKVIYQPKYDLKTNKLVSAEALVRWVSPDIQLFPDQFIPVFEGNGFIIELDHYVFDKVCEFINDNKELDLNIAVNLSAKTLLSDHVVEGYEKILKKYNVSPHNIEIEITESAIVNQNAKVISRVKEFKKLGLSIAIDDFGAGTSSLNRLKEIDVDVLKLDRAFINSNLEVDKGTLIINSLIELSKQLRLKIVAEGIETKQQLDVLRALGCDIGQGYYYSRPIEKEELIKKYKAESKQQF